MTDMARIGVMVELATTVLEAVKASGLLAKKRGRKPGVKAKRRGRPPGSKNKAKASKGKVKIPAKAIANAAA